MNLSALCPRPDFLQPFDDWSALDGVRIGLTGHRGTLGSLLALRLQRAGATFSEFEGDVTSEPDLIQWVSHVKPEIVFHFAAVVPVGKVNEDPTRAIRVNSIAPFFLAETLRRSARDAWLFHASTSHVYPASTISAGIDPPRLSELTHCAPASLYGATKHAGEQLLTPFCDAVGVRLCVGRIFSFFHEIQPPSFLVPGLLSRISCTKEHDSVDVSDPESVRDFLYAEHVVDAVLHLATRRFIGIVNIASGKSLSVGSIAERLVKLSDSPVGLRLCQRGVATSLVPEIKKLRALLNQGLPP